MGNNGERKKPKKNKTLHFLLPIKCCNDFCLKHNLLFFIFLWNVGMSSNMIFFRVGLLVL